MLTYKAQLAGIKVVVQEEGYTSKCSFLDLEPSASMPSIAVDGSSAANLSQPRVYRSTPTSMALTTFCEKDFHRLSPVE